MAPRAKLTREKVLTKAARLANVKGWDNLNLHTLAAELGIKPPSLYNHIKGLADLKHGLAIQSSRALVEQIKNATIGKSGVNACLGMAFAYLEFARANPGLLPAIAVAPDRANEEHMTIDKDFMAMGIAIMSGFKLSDTERVHGLRALRCATHGFAVLEQEQGFGIDINPDESFEWMIRKLIAGFPLETESENI